MKRYEHPEQTGAVSTTEQTPEQRRRMIVTVVIFLAAIVLLLASPLPSGIVAMGAALLLILLRCTSPKSLSKVSWGTILLVVGSVSMGEGIDRSGAGMVVSQAIIGLFGELGQSPFAMCCLMLLVAATISNFMANNAAVTITAPIALGMAATLGANPIPFGLACAVGSLISCATPLCNANVTMSTAAGYRFKDYVVWGLPNNVLAFLGCSVALWFVYFI